MSFRQFCSEKNIPYTHFPTLMDNLKSTASYFIKFGRDSDTRENMHQEKHKFNIGRICSHMSCMAAVVIFWGVGGYLL